MKQFLKAIRIGKITKSAVALVLALSVLLSTFAGLSIFANPTDGWNWEVEKDTDFEGNGTQYDPFLIQTKEELYGLVTSDNTQGKYYKLTTDIHINDTTKLGWGETAIPWVDPVSTQDGVAFKGHFDGAGHKVYGLYVNVTTADTAPQNRAEATNVAAGLFPVVADGATISGVGVEEAYISVKNSSDEAKTQPHGAVGALVGYMKGENVKISLSYAGENNILCGAYAGLIGFSDIGYKEVVNCYTLATGTVNTRANTADNEDFNGNRTGLVGSTAVNSGNKNNIYFFGCYAFGNVSATLSAVTAVKNNYSINAGKGVWESNLSVKINSAESIKVNAAKENMPLLSWDEVYKTTVGYPTLKLFGGEATAAPTDVWDGKTVTQPVDSDNDGIYEITNGAELAWATAGGANTKNKKFVLLNDIVLNDITVKIENGVGVIYEANGNKTKNTAYLNKWSMTQATTEGVVIDGNGHIVRGLVFDDASATGSYGLTRLTYGSTFKNLGIEDMYANVPGGSVAAFVGSVHNQHNVYIKNCYVGESVYINAKNAAGFFAQGNQSGKKVSVEDAYVLATLVGTNKVGAVTGDVWGSSDSSSNSTMYRVFATTKLLGNTAFKWVGNNYSTVSGYNTTVVSLDDMKGASALTKMALGDAFVATAGYPVLKAFVSKDSVWDGLIYEPKDKNSDGIYEITNGAELAWATAGGANTKNKKFVLLNDIVLNDITVKIENGVGVIYDSKGNKVTNINTLNKWSMTQATTEGVVIDGNGHVIRGLVFDDASATGSYGLTRLTYGSTFKNLGIEDMYANVPGGSVAAFVGSVHNQHNVYIKNCYVGESVYIKAKNAAGFFANGNQSGKKVSVEDAYVLATLVGTNKVGAVTGDVWGTSDSGSNSTMYRVFATTKLLGNTAFKWVGNNYSTVSGLNTTVVSLADMKGANALTKMALGGAFAATDGYPVLRVFTDTSPVWDGKQTAPIDADGDGIYEINNASELAWATSGSNDANNKKYILTKDIILNDITVKIENGVGVIYDAAGNKVTNTSTLKKWTSGTAVGVTIDGNNHVIRGLFLEDASSTGKFGLVNKAWAVTFKNLGIEDMYANVPNGYVAALVGDIGGQHNNVVSNVYVDDSVYIKANVAAGFFATGAQSGSNKQTVKNAYVLATFDTTGKAGAVTGDVWGCQNTNSIITNVYSTTKLFGNNQFKYQENSYLATDAMKGENALTAMPLGEAFVATEGYPILKTFAPVAPEGDGEGSGEGEGSSGGEGQPENDNIWDGTKKVPAGSGTEADPYLIYTAEEFAWAMSNTTESNKKANVQYKLMADIYLNDVTKIDWTTGKSNDASYEIRKWTPVDFAGTVDGNGHIVYGLYVSKNIAVCSGSSSGGVGLLNANYNNYAANFKKIGFDKAYVSGPNSAGLISANVKNGGINVDRSYVGADVTVQGYSAAGFVGYGWQQIEITNSYSLATNLNSKDGMAGAILGNNWGGNAVIRYSYAAGKLFGHKDVKTAFSYTGAAAGNDSATVLTSDEMKGLDVISNKMPNLINAFTATEGYPELCVFKGVDEVPVPEISDKVWDGTKKTAAGLGSATEPYLIYTAEEFAWAMNNAGASLTAYYKLMDDIYLNDVNMIDWTTGEKKNNGYVIREWTPAAFAGTVMGNGHKVYGLYVNQNPTEYSEDRGNNGAALLKENWWKGTANFEEIGFDNAYVHGAHSAAVIVATVKEGGVNIDRTFVGKNVTVKGWAAAGFVAYGGYNIQVTNSYSLAANISSEDGKAGAILGNNWGGNAVIKNSFSNGKLFGHKDIKSAFSYTGVAAGNESAILLTDDNMKGTDALTVKAKMPNLGNAFTATEGYPELCVFKGITEAPTPEIGESVWDGTKNPAANGKGTEEDPYLIYTAEEFAWAINNATSSLTAHYKLMADIYLNDVTMIDWTKGQKKDKGYIIREWKPADFAGTVDGNGHMVYGLYVNYDADLYSENRYKNGAGLLHANWYQAAANFKNIGFDYAYLHGPHSAGVFAANVKDGGINIDRSFVGKNVTVKAYSAGGFVGVGWQNIAVTNSYSHTTSVEAKDGKAGAILGNTWGNASIKNSYAIGKLYGSEASPVIFSYTGVAAGTAELISLKNMVGMDALTNENKMILLGNAFCATESYPELCVFHGISETPAPEIGENVWDGVSVTKPTKGNGTVFDPYLISNGAELAWALSGNNSGNYYRLTDDIYLNDINSINWNTGKVKPEKAGYMPRVWTPATFNGSIEGDGHTIYGLYVNKNATEGTWGWNSLGLITKTDGATSIEKLGIDYAYVNGQNTVAAFVGHAEGKTSFTECYVGENVTLQGFVAGGFVGVSAGGISVSNSYSAIQPNRIRLHKATGDGKPLGAGILGDCWGANSVANSYSASKAIANRAELTNVYATEKDPKELSIIVTNSNMKGLDVLSNENKMPGLAACGSFKATKGYPVLKVFAEGVDYSTQENEIWSGKIARTMQGSGTKANPYLISNGAELAFAIVKGGFGGAYFKLTNDIFLNDVSGSIRWAQNTTNNKWFSDTTPFNGHIDGDGYIVYGLWYPEDTQGIIAGLVPVMEQGSITNLGVRYAHVRATTFAGGIIGSTAHMSGKLVTVENCFADDTCNIKYTEKVNGGAAGILGYARNNNPIDGNKPAIHIKNSYSKAALSGAADARTNGIIGTAWATAYKLENVYSYLDTPYMGWNIGTASLLITKNTEDTADDDNNVHVNVYTDAAAPWLLESWTYIAKAEDMYGDNAKTSMSGLDFENIWKTVDETTPMLSVFKNYNGQVTDMSGDTEVYASGTGTKKDPFVIKNEAQLRYLIESRNTKNKYYKLGADIVINDTSKKNWQVNNPSVWYTATFNGEYIFEGTFDGAGYKIYGLYTNEKAEDLGIYTDKDGVARPSKEYANRYTGLFPYVDGNAVIKNVHVRNSYIAGSGYAGSIVGFVRGSGSFYTTVMACSADESVMVKGQIVGGLVGGGYRGLKLYYSYFTGKLDAKAAALGRQSGLVGDIWSTDQEVAESYSVGYHNYRLDTRTNYTPGVALYLYGTEAQTGTKVLTKAQMTGSAAKKNMEFTWDDVWYVEEGKTPQLKVIPDDFKLTFIDEGEKGRVWSGKVSSGFAGGTGTADDPYIIETPEQMAYLVSRGSESVGNYYKLVADLKLNDTSYSGWEKHARQWFTGYLDFGGHFDGGGHVISGLYYNGSYRHASLFPRITGGCVIEKLGIIDTKIINKINEEEGITETYTAPFGSYYAGWTDESKGYTEPVLSQCFADDTVYLEGRFVGGLVGGTPTKVHIDNCYFTGTIVSDDHHGTMIANTWSNDQHVSTITNSYSSATDRNKMASNNGAPYIQLQNYYHDGQAGHVSANTVGLIFMKGDYAKEYMDGLDYEKIWKIVKDGTPVLRCFANAEKYSCTRMPAKVELAFITGGGTECESLYGLPGYDKITKDMLPTPTRYGYDFGGWYFFEECDLPFNLEVFPEYDAYLYAKWIDRGYTQDFEGQIDESYDFNSAAQIFKPGVMGYKPKFVHGGLRSARTLAGEEQGMFLVSYDNMLKVGNIYEISVWMNTTTDGATGKIELLHANHGQYDSDIMGYETAYEFENIKAGSWEKYTFKIVANAPFIIIKAPMDCELYFDDIQVVDTGETGKLGQIEGYRGGIFAWISNLGLVWTIVIVAGALLILGGGTVLTVVLVKKSKAKKSQ